MDLDGLVTLGVGEQARVAVREVLADLPLVPDASCSALLIGPPDVALACLAVLARHVGQGLRDTNLTIAHDRQHLRAERLKLVFLSASALAEVLDAGDDRPLREAVLFLHDVSSPLPGALWAREADGLASFVTATRPLGALGHWRAVIL